MYNHPLACLVIWANVKAYVAKTNVNGCLKEAIGLADQKFLSIDQEDWLSVCRKSGEFEVIFAERKHSQRNLN